jgi:DNA-binding XRE family transcriptional regulator
LTESIDSAILASVTKRHPLHGRHSVQGYDWETRRRQILGYGDHRREAVAKALGISRRSIERYETEGPPKWYEPALIGLARHRLEVKVSSPAKKKP